MPLSLALGAAAAASHPAGGDRVLEHAADGGGQGPRLPPQQALHAALGRQQGEVRQTPAGVQAEELVAVDGNVKHVYEGRSGDEEEKGSNQKEKDFGGSP